MKPTYKNIFLTALFLLIGFGAFSQDKATDPQQVEKCPIRTPNAFTPNDDGVNDFFYFTFVEDCQPVSFSLQIFDRLGRLVFETKDYLEKWDGRYDGQELKDGGYFWVMSAKVGSANFDEKPTNYQKKGSVLIVR